MTIFFWQKSQVKVTTFFLNLKDDENKYSYNCSYADICLRYEVSIIHQNDRISEFLLACTTLFGLILK